MNLSMQQTDTLVEIRVFLRVPTPVAWLRRALEQLDTLLVDHAQCEQKAAASAMKLIRRYPEDRSLCMKMSKLAREEMRHFEQVLQVLKSRGSAWRGQSASRYAAALLEGVAREPAACKRDLLLVGAIIEARSCERFAALVPLLASQGETRLAAFYAGLLASEGRHYRDYLLLAARNQAPAVVESALTTLLDRENELITRPDAVLRFHSGPPD